VSFGGRVEGLHAVAAAVAAGRVLRLHVASNRAGAAEVQPLIESASAAGAEVRVVDREQLSALAETEAPQGVVAEARPLRFVSVEEAVAATHPAALVMLDHIQDGRNVGAIARSAVAAGIGAMVVSTRRAAPLGAATMKAAAGALERLPVAAVNSIPDTLRTLHKDGVWTVGLDSTGDRSLFGLEILTEPVAVIIGAEGSGLSRLVKERADVVASIPTTGVESLNASVAAALAMFEVARARTPSDLG
jgi:23S rRNA (guanosine2251-2'-O)-methyltransferase